jgi:ubiquinone biosynthesis protein Coq4
MKRLVDALVFGRTIWSFADLVRHPEHLGRVFEISDAMTRQSAEVFRVVREHFGRDEQGAAAIREKHRLRVDLDELSALPPGTLGRVFADHMRANRLDPRALPTLSAEDDFGFVRAHLYETHDVWHAVTGFGADVAGELGLQAFYAAQIPSGLPMLLLAIGFLNTAFYRMDERQPRIDAIARGWQMGKRAQPLFGVRWDELWGQPIDDVREGFGVCLSRMAT